MKNAYQKMIDTLRKSGRPCETISNKCLTTLIQSVEMPDFCNVVSELDRLARDTGVKTIAQGGFRNATVGDVQITAVYDSKYCAARVSLTIPTFAFGEYSLIY